MSFTKLFPVLTFISLSPLLSAQDPVLTGTWVVDEWKEFGQVTEPSFRFVTFNADGSATISNGVETLPCWSEFGGGRIKLQHTAANVWQGAPESQNFKGGYQPVDEGRIQLVVPPGGSSVSFTPEAMKQAYWSIRFTKVPAERLAKTGARGRSPKAQESLSHLARLGARFRVNELGQVIVIDLSDSSCEAGDLGFVSGLPALESLVVGSKARAEELSEIFPGLKISPPKEVYSKLWQKRYDSAAGKAFDEGRRKRSELGAHDSAGKPAPVFEAVTTGEESGVPAFLFPIRGSLFAIHPALPRSVGPPQSMSHDNLDRPVPLGKPVLESCEFQIRQFAGKPGPEWSFEPVPPECSVLYDGLHLKVCLPDRQLDAFVNVSKITGNDRIVPGSPVDGTTVHAILIGDPDEETSGLGGCPVVDARTGHLVGVVSGVKNDLNEIQCDLTPIHDLTRIPEPASAYAQTSFFNLGSATLGRGQAAKLVGILPPDILSLRMGESDVEDYYESRPNVLLRDREEFLGREYLFSRFTVRNASGAIVIAGASGERVRLDDPRVRGMTDFLLGLYGEPSRLYGGEPDGESFASIALAWDKPKAGIRLDISHSKFENTLRLILALDAREEPRLEGLFSSKELKGNVKSRDLVEGFFDRLEGLPQEPKSRISSLEILREMLKE